MLNPRGKSVIQEAEDEQSACVKDGWDLSAPYVVMDLSKPLSKRSAAIDTMETLHRAISLDRVGDYTILGPAFDAKVRQITVMKRDALNSSGYTACLKAGWGPEDCKPFDLKVTGLAIDALALLRKSIGRDGETRK